MTVGFWGKIPSRGDFVSYGVSRPFVRAWDDWMSVMLAHSQQTLGANWQQVWLEAPVWRFVAGPGLLGPAAMAGLWMPSVDKAGRWFPLALVIEGKASEVWFEEVEELGRTTLEYGLGPDDISAQLAPPPLWPDVDPPASGSRWWTEGSPRVEAQELLFAGLPPVEAFVRMIDGTLP